MRRHRAHIPLPPSMQGWLCQRGCTRSDGARRSQKTFAKLFQSSLVPASCAWRAQYAESLHRHPQAVLAAQLLRPVIPPALCKGCGNCRSLCRCASSPLCCAKFRAFVQSLRKQQRRLRPMHLSGQPADSSGPAAVPPRMRLQRGLAKADLPLMEKRARDVGVCRSARSGPLTVPADLGSIAQTRGGQQHQRFSACNEHRAGVFETRELSKTGLEITLASSRERRQGLPLKTAGAGIKCLINEPGLDAGSRCLHLGGGASNAQAVEPVELLNV